MSISLAWTLHTVPCRSSVTSNRCEVPIRVMRCTKTLRRPSLLYSSLLLATCAAGSLVAIQACGSAGNGIGQMGGGTGGEGVVANAGAPSGADSSGVSSTAGSPAAGASNTLGGATGATAAAGAGGVVSGASGATGAGAGVAGAAGGMLVNEGDSVLERKHHPSSDGHFMKPLLTKAALAKMAADTGFAGNFTGQMWASPVYISNGPGGKGAFFAVTTGNDVIPLDETTGQPLASATGPWKKNFNIGPAPQNTGVPCGQIHPLGIISTPVIDATSRTIYVAGAVGTDTITSHEVHAINIDDGSERAGWPVNVTGMKSGNVTFAPPAQNQRSALSLVGGKVYVAYGGHAGDCGNYHGWVIGIVTTDPTMRGGWATVCKGEAIWAAGGMASDGTSIFAVTGNSTVGAADRATSDSEQVVRLTGLGVLARSDQNLYFPTSWKQMDSGDSDFGSSNPVYFSILGATPANFIGAVAKNGNFYLLNAANLGGMGGHVQTLSVATGAMSIKTAPTVYRTAKGTHFVLGVDANAQCPGGVVAGRSMISVLLTAGSPPKASVEWCSPFQGEAGPISTTTDGTNNALVWYVNDDKLMAVDGDTGQALYTSKEACSGVRKWTSAIAVKGRIIAGGDGHLCSWSAH